HSVKLRSLRDLVSAPRPSSFGKQGRGAAESTSHRRADVTRWLGLQRSNPARTRRRFVGEALPLLLAAAVIAAVFFAASPAAFVVKVRDGKPAATRGKVTDAFLA